MRRMRAHARERFRPVHAHAARALDEGLDDDAGDVVRDGRERTLEGVVAGPGSGTCTASSPLPVKAPCMPSTGSHSDIVAKVSP